MFPDSDIITRITLMITITCHPWIWRMNNNACTLVNNPKWSLDFKICQLIRILPNTTSKHIINRSRNYYKVKLKHPTTKISNQFLHGIITKFSIKFFTLLLSIFNINSSQNKNKMCNQKAMGKHLKQTKNLPMRAEIIWASVKLNFKIRWNYMEINTSKVRI